MDLSPEIILTGKPAPTAPRIGIHGLGGVGKTSLAAQFPSPIFLTSPGETGLDTLISTNQIEPVSRFPEVKEWDDVVACVKFLLEGGSPDSKTFVLDTAPGLLRMLHVHVCETEYGGNWGPKGFGNYSEGMRECTPRWYKFLMQLDKLRKQRGMTIILLMHTEIKNFNNPEGLNYDRFIPDFPKDDWTKTHGWLDTTLFMNYVTDTEKQRGEGKATATGGVKRAFFTEHTAAYDAKGGRYGLPSVIELPNNAPDAYQVLVKSMKAAGKPKESGNGN